jgi:predicted acetyltransferase
MKTVDHGDKTGMYTYITLRERPDLKEKAAAWFCDKFNVPKKAYLDCMDAYLEGETEYGWYLCLYEEKIVGGLGVIENDFHERKDLSPNICAVFTEKEYRCKGIAGNLLKMAVEDLRSKGISPVYLVTDHTGFYERYGWEFLCMVQPEHESEFSRMYIHR